MKWNVRNPLLYILCLTFVLPADAKAREPNCPRDSKHAGYIVDMPISLGIGTVRTPEFAVKRKPYLIAIQAQWLLPAEELKCRMGFALIPSDDRCTLEPLIEAEWTVLDGDRVVAHGLNKGRNNDFEGGACYLGRFLGEFAGRVRAQISC
jgi:hypothetical protein